MINFLKNFGILWWGIFGAISAILSAIIGFYTQTYFYFGITLVSAVITIIALFYKQNRKIHKISEELAQLKNPPVDFIITKGNEPYFTSVSFFDQIGGIGQFEVIIPCSLSNTANQLITLTVSARIETDLPIVENQEYEIHLSSTGKNKIEMKVGYTEFVPLRMWVKLNLSQAEKCLIDIANASYFRVLVTYAQHDSKSYQAIYEIKQPQKLLIAEYEERFANVYAFNGHKSVDGKRAIERLKYLWKILP